MQRREDRSHGQIGRVLANDSLYLIAQRSTAPNMG
jgi:hypothetical protein